MTLKTDAELTKEGGGKRCGGWGGESIAFTAAGMFVLGKLMTCQKLNLTMNSGTTYCIGLDAHTHDTQFSLTLGHILFA